MLFRSSNGNCSVATLCNVLQGNKYNAPVGLGVPNNPNAFQSRGSAVALTGGSPSLAIAETSNGPWAIGQNNGQLTLTVDNVGTGPTSGNVTVTGTLPSGSTLGNTPNSANCTSSNAQFTCTIASAIAAQSSVTLNLNVNLPSSGMGTSVTTTASAYGGGDSVHASSSSEVTTTLTTADRKSVV